MRLRYAGLVNRMAEATTAGGILS